MNIVKLPTKYYQSDDGSGNGGANSDGDGETKPNNDSTKTPGGESKDKNDNTDSSDELKGQLEKLVGKVEYLTTEQQKIIKQRDDLKKMLREKDREGAEGSGDIESLKKSYLEEKEALLADLETERANSAKLKEQFHTTLTKDKLRSVSAGLIADKAFETFFFENGSTFDVDDKGDLISKDGIRSPAEAIKKILTEKPFYAAAATSKQTGFPGADTGREASVIPDGFFDWTDQERRAYTAKLSTEDRRKMGKALINKQKR